MKKYATTLLRTMLILGLLLPLLQTTATAQDGWVDVCAEKRANLRMTGQYSYPLGGGDSDSFELGAVLHVHQSHLDTAIREPGELRLATVGFRLPSPGYGYLEGIPLTDNLANDNLNRTHPWRMYHSSVVFKTAPDGKVELAVIFVHDDFLGEWGFRLTGTFQPPDGFQLDSIQTLDDLQTLFDLPMTALRAEILKNELAYIGLLTSEGDFVKTVPVDKQAVDESGFGITYAVDFSPAPDGVDPFFDGASAVNFDLKFDESTRFTSLRDVTLVNRVEGQATVRYSDGGPNTTLRLLPQVFFVQDGLYPVGYFLAIANRRDLGLVDNRFALFIGKVTFEAEFDIGDLKSSADICSILGDWENASLRLVTDRVTLENINDNLPVTRFEGNCLGAGESGNLSVTIPAPPPLAGAWYSLRWSDLPDSFRARAGRLENVEVTTSAGGYIISSAQFGDKLVFYRGYFDGIRDRVCLRPQRVLHEARSIRPRRQRGELSVVTLDDCVSESRSPVTMVDSSEGHYAIHENWGVGVKGRRLGRNYTLYYGTRLQFVKKSCVLPIIP